MTQRPVGVLGGTFDPIHNGHLRPALEILEALEFTEIRLIPGRQPPHRGQPSASPEQRLAMVRLAIAEQPGFVLDDCELRREGPSYMVDTLSELRARLGDTPLCLLVGADAFNGLPTWQHWEAIPKLAHLVVFYRPGVQPSAEAPLSDLINRHRLSKAEALRESPAGGVLFQPVTQLDISATRIRTLLAQQRSARYLLPEPVYAYIQKQGLYAMFPST